MASTLKEDLELFREHVRELKKLGYSHVHVKRGNLEMFVEAAGPAPASEHVGNPIGFVPDEDDE